MLADPRLELVFVDDGSSDGTARVLNDFADERPRVSVLRFGHNRGKGEAVRAGMVRGVASGCDAVGYADADLATPVSELVRLVDVMDGAPAVDAVIGARVAVLGAQIQRRARRHYFGRVFATAASVVLRAPVYDTQCGAKVFRVVPALAGALEQPFASRWAFDVELLGRLMAAGCAVVEEPLRAWRDVAGSKISVPAMVRSTFELFAIERRLRKLR